MEEMPNYNLIDLLNEAGYVIRQGTHYISCKKKRRYKSKKELYATCRPSAISDVVSINLLNITSKIEPIFLTVDPRHSLYEQISCGVPVRGIDVYAAYYNLNDEFIFTLENGYSMATKRYFLSTRKRIGLLNSATLPYYSDSNIGLSLCKKIIDTGFGTAKIRNYIDTARCSVYLSTDTPSKKVYKHLFLYEPSVFEIETAQALMLIEEALTANRTELYSCMACKKEVFWIDIPGSPLKKWEAFYHYTCGCMSKINNAKSAHH